MLFNSYSFIFFIPVTVAGYFLFGRLARDWALGWLTLASLLFYAWWNPLKPVRHLWRAREDLHVP